MTTEISSQELTKKCRVCEQELPLNRFSLHITNKDGLRGECKRCNYDLRKEKAAPHKAKWRKDHQEQLTNYGRLWRLKRDGIDTATIPHPPEECPSKHRACWKYFAKDAKWVCGYCEMEQGAINRRIQKRRSQRLKRAVAVRLHYGEELGAVYLGLINDDESNDKAIDDLFLESKKRICTERFGFRPDKDWMKRLVFLNQLVGQEALAKGWNCTHCKMRNDDPTFFDVDHILRRADGGSNDPTNLQVLCPNCHRIKSLQENRNFMRQAITSTPPGVEGA